MKTQVYISVGIPFYNNEQYLETAIISVIKQSYPYWELILLDDGSTDKSLSIAHKFATKDKRIRVISDGKNIKLPKRLNQLIDESKYQYIARMDSDDIMHPLRLETQIKFLLDNPNYDLVSSGLISINHKNEIQGYRCVLKTIWGLDNISISYPIAHPSVMAKKEWYVRNRYNNKYFRAEDFELWTRAIVNNDFKIVILSDLLLFYREQGNLSIDKIMYSYKQVFSIYKEYKGIDFYLIKLFLKKYIVLILNKFNMLQYARNSSNKEMKAYLQKKYQKILYDITDGI